MMIEKRDIKRERDDTFADTYYTHIFAEYSENSLLADVSGLPK